MDGPDAAKQLPMHVTVRLLDEHEHHVVTVRVDSDKTFAVNDWFTAPDGGRYVVCEVQGDEVTATWLDGPRPCAR